MKLPDIVTAPRTDPIYNCHSYLTKVPIGAILPFIELLSDPGDVVLDPFAGSGMTGIAAFMLGRRFCLSDISALGRHIARGYLTEISPNLLRETARNVVKKARMAIRDYYTTIRIDDGQRVEMIRTIWSFTYRCPRCSTPFTYFERLVEGGMSPPKSCTKCGEPFARRSWPRNDDVPVRIIVEGRNGRQVEQHPAAIDLESISRAGIDGRQDEIPSLPIEEWREMHRRSALSKHKLTETKKFFSSRNAIALLELWRAIGSLGDERLRQKLLFVFTSILPRSSKRYQWGPKRPLNAQNQTYYISPVYYEWNVFDLFGRKVEATIRSDNSVFRGLTLFSGNGLPSENYRIASADALDHIPSASVDYVFTDPPFGSNIYYSDMNLFQEAWIGSTTDYSREAVIHTSGTKKIVAAERYQTLLQGAIGEAYRVLKPGRFISLVFGNSSGSIWRLLQHVFRVSGFAPVPVHVAILDKGQRSVKGLNSGSESVATLDLVLTFQKPHDGEKTSIAEEIVKADPQKLINKALSTLDEEKPSNPSYIYACIIREAIKNNQTVEHIHLSDVLIALRNAGYSINSKTGLLSR